MIFDISEDMCTCFLSIVSMSKYSARSSDKFIMEYFEVNFQNFCVSSKQGQLSNQFLQRRYSKNRIANKAIQRKSIKTIKLC